MGGKKLHGGIYHGSLNKGKINRELLHAFLGSNKKDGSNGVRPKTKPGLLDKAIKVIEEGLDSPIYERQIFAVEKVWKILPNMLPKLPPAPVGPTVNVLNNNAPAKAKDVKEYFSTRKLDMKNDLDASEEEDADQQDS